MYGSAEDEMVVPSTLLAGIPGESLLHVHHAFQRNTLIKLPYVQLCSYWDCDGNAGKVCFMIKGSRTLARSAECLEPLNLQTLNPKTLHPNSHWPLFHDKPE